MNFNHCTCIYMIRNKINDCVYVGQTTDYAKRKRTHIGFLRNNMHRNPRLQSDFNIYGEDAFEFSIIEYCNKDELDGKEIYWINYYDSINNGYNIRKGGQRMIQNEQLSVRGRNFCGKNNPRSKPVICENTGIIYESARQASMENRISQSAITMCCNRQRSYAGCDSDGNRLLWLFNDGHEPLCKDEIYRMTHECDFNKIKKCIRGVRCITTNEEFVSIASAGRFYGIDISGIAKACKGQFGGMYGRHPETGERLKWEYLNNVA